MAELTPTPSLPSTADATPYVPVSWTAVAALAVAVTFAVTLLGFGIVAFTNKKPLLEDWLLAMPVIAVVLSFAARRVIRNSEGTRTGERLAVAAWWIAVIFGLCYVAYLFAIDFAIQRDIRDEAKTWMGHVNQGGEEGLALAFYRTLSPGARPNIAPNDLRTMKSRFRDEILMFENCDLMKLARRNQGELSFEPGSASWNYKPGSIEGVLTGTVKCAEGSFPVVVGVKGVEGVTGAEGGGGGRQWMIDPPRGSGFVNQSAATRTAYGWMLQNLEADGGQVGQEFVAHAMAGSGSRPYVYRAFVAEGGDRKGWAAVARNPDTFTTLVWQFAFAAPARVAGDAGYADYMANRFYKLPGGAEPSPDQKARFFHSWNSQGIRPAGDKLKTPDGNPVDKEIIATVTEAAVEVRVPIEIPIPSTGKLEAARGRVVVECRDPALLAELKQLRSSANPDQGTAAPPTEILNRRVAWRVARVESDMVPINIAPPRPMPGDPGAMPGG